MKRRFILALVCCSMLGLSGCGLINDAISIITPKPGALGVAIQAPAGTNAEVEVVGPNLSKTFQDDGRGFAIKLEATPGDYQVKPSVVAGYSALLSLTTIEGNSTVKGSTSVTIKSGQDAAVVIKYQLQAN